MDCKSSRQAPQKAAWEEVGEERDEDENDADKEGFVIVIATPKKKIRKHEMLSKI